MRKNTPVTDHEVLYPASYNLLSTTDLKGKITYASPDFCEVAGFSEEELLGQPHNIVRHPDMPELAFADLWNHVKAGKTWQGMVKNRCKNGDFYWVNAFVSPIIRDGQIVEYQSVRLKPSRILVERATQTYQRLQQQKQPKKMWLSRLSLPTQLCLGAVLSLVPSLLLGALSQWWLGAGLYFILSLILPVMLSGRLRRIVERSKTIFDNPLMSYIYHGRSDDLAAIELAMTMQRAELNAVTGRILDSSRHIRRSADSSRDNSEQTLKQLSQQSMDTEQIATAIGQMSQATENMAENTQAAASAAASAADISSQSALKAREAGQMIHSLALQLHDASATMARLKEYGNQIEASSTEISKIAEQTNLLALNAAIESARAGEHGRGFSVVADEVRKLAQNTQASTQQIQSVIESIREVSLSASQIIDEGRELADQCVTGAQQANQQMDESLGQVQSITSRNEQIAAAVEEQVQVSRDIQQNVERIHHSNQQCENIARDSTRYSGELTDALVQQCALVEQLRRVDAD